MKIAGRVAIVTGGGDGIGAALAVALTASGARVVRLVEHTLVRYAPAIGRLVAADDFDDRLTVDLSVADMADPRSGHRVPPGLPLPARPRSRSRQTRLK